MAKGWSDGLWTMRVSDYLGRAVTFSIPYNPSNLNIINPGLTGSREAGCLFDVLLIGRGRRQQGAVNAVPIPEGDFSATRQQLSAAGFSTIQQVVDSNVTIGLSGLDEP